MWSSKRLREMDEVDEEGDAIFGSILSRLWKELKELDETRIEKSVLEKE